MTTAHDDHDDTGTSFKVDRDEQPERDDLIDPPEDIEPTEVEDPTIDREVGELPDPEELPESQGSDVLDAVRQSEDSSSRQLLSDEEAEEGA